MTQGNGLLRSDLFARSKVLEKLHKVQRLMGAEIRRGAAYLCARLLGCSLESWTYIPGR